MTQFTVGTGFPETPIFPAAVPGTGWIGPLRPGPDRRSSLWRPEWRASQCVRIHPPAAGAWGNAGRNSITGPNTFSLDGAMQRTFRPNKHFYLDARIDATNLLNHPVFTGWNTVVQSTQFGLPQSVNQMRSMQATMRVRF